jgi:hypothetical protein
MIDHTQDADRSEGASVFDEHRGLLVSVAYRVLGSVTDAEDAVQEAWIRWSGADHSSGGEPREAGRRPGSRAASMKRSRGLEARLRKMSPRTHRRREELPQRPPRPGGLNTDGRRS